MTSLPSPTTRSPGKLKLIYGDTTTVHEVGSNFNDTVDVTVIPPIRTEATAIANLLKAGIYNTKSITGWKITDPSGVTLYEEVFSPAIVGTKATASNEFFSDSGSVCMTGKGAPSVGLKQGQTKFTVFGGYYDTVLWAVPRQPATAYAWVVAMIAHLNTSTLIGSDFYGSPGVWRGYFDTQINAHFQKRLGI